MTRRQLTKKLIHPRKVAPFISTIVPPVSLLTVAIWSSRELVTALITIMKMVQLKMVTLFKYTTIWPVHEGQ